jgi:hypothetical protein
MGYVGVPPQSGFITTAKQRITSSTNNYVDLDHSISSLADVIVWVNSVKQDSTNLTLTTSTRITLGGTLVSSDVCEIAFLGKAVATQTPSSGTVTNDMLAGSIANSKLANSSITLNGSAVSLGGSATIGSDSGTESFMVTNSSNQSVTDNAWTKVTLDTEQFDVGNNFSSNKYTVPSTGKYLFAWCLAFATNGSYGCDNGFTRIYKNGSVIHIQGLPNHNTGGGAAATFDTGSLPGTLLLDLAQNDYIELYGRLNWNSNATAGYFYSDTSGSVHRRTWFSGMRIA